MIQLPQKVFSQVGEVALLLIGEDAAKKAAAVDDMRRIAFQTLTARGDIGFADAYEAAEALAARLSTRLDEFELLQGNA